MGDERCEEQREYRGAGDRQVSGIPWQHPVKVHGSRERPERHNGGHSRHCQQSKGQIVEQRGSLSAVVSVEQEIESGEPAEQ